MITSAEITPENALESDDLSLIHSSSDADNDVERLVLQNGMSMAQRFQRLTAI